MHSVRRGLGTLAVGSLAISGLGAPAAFADTAPTAPKYVVAGDDAWTADAYSVADPNTTVATVQGGEDGPGHAPYGTASHKIVVGADDTEAQVYRTDAYAGTALASLTRLEYSTYAHSTGDGAPLRQPTYLRLTVDADGDGTADTTLFFRPSDNTDQQAVADDTWQTWNVTAGKVADGTGAGAQVTPFATYVTDHPNAKLATEQQGGKGVGTLALLDGGTQGGADDAQVNGEYHVDRVIVGAGDTDTLYDLGADDEVAGSDHPTVVNDDQNLGWTSLATMGGSPVLSDQKFVREPSTLEHGVGSLELTIGAGRVEQFRTAAYDTHRYLRDLRTLDYATYQSGTNQPASVHLQVANGDGTGNATLDYLPADNETAQAVAADTWQTWHAAADAAQWRVEGDTDPARTMSLQDYLVQHPDATITNTGTAGDAATGGVAFVVGGTTTQGVGNYYLDDLALSFADPTHGRTVSGLRYDLEPAPRITIGDARIREGNVGSVLSFPVTMDTVANRTITIGFGTADGSALSGKDYVDRTGTVTIPVGAKTARVNIRVLSDMVRERDETMTVTIGNASYGEITDDTATGTIVNDDTTVGLSLARATAHRVRVHVGTVPAAKGSRVTVYRIVKGNRVRVLSTTLDRYGKVSALLGKQYAPGTRVTFVATVRTKYGTYTSPAKRITIRR